MNDKLDEILDLLKSQNEMIKRSKALRGFKKGDKQRENDCPQIRYRSTDMHVNKSHESFVRGDYGRVRQGYIPRKT